VMQHNRREHRHRSIIKRSSVCYLAVIPVRRD
jgi:hypothetical protein